MPEGSHESAQEALKKYFGYEQFRPGQWEIIESTLGGRDTLAVLPTGGGKSLCYQLPAILTPGLTLVVSPLISLMKDQVDALSRAGIRAAEINSTLDYRESMQRIENAQHGMYKMLYIAPERFESVSFLERIRHVNISLFAVDEAHCISEWGHNFRPSYRRLKDAIAFLNKPPILALTATATPDVRKDIAVQLELREPKVVVQGFARENLSFRVAQNADKRDYILNTAMKGGCGIVYAGTRKSVEQISEFLNAHGISTAPYHAGLPDRTRKAAQERFLTGEVKVIVATTAFGMGIDKPDVRFVIHHDMPGTIEQYYQEAGRAGRDGQPSTCTLLYAPADKSLPEFFINNTYPDRAFIQSVYTHLQNAAGTASGSEFTGLLPSTVHSIAAQIGNASDSMVHAALQSLEEAGYIRQVHASYSESNLQFTASPEYIRTWLSESTSEHLKPIVVSLLRSVGGGAFHFRERMNFEDIVEKANLSEEAVYSGLQELKREGLIQFHLGQKGSGIALLGPRISPKELAIDFSAIQARKQHQYEKLQAVEYYITSADCRRNLILQYFDESAEGTCGNCDNCTTKALPTETRDERTDLQQSVLACIAELGGKFGKTVVIDVLRGAKTKRIAQFRLYEATTYSIASKAEKQELSDTIDSMLGMGWLNRTDSIHPAVYVSEVGESRLKRRISPLELPRISDTHKDTVKSPELYNALRTVRRRVAARHNVPSYQILHDSVLRNVANAVPKDSDEFLRIEGVGPVTFDRCGKEMLEVIRDFNDRKEMQAAQQRTQESKQSSIPKALRPAYNQYLEGRSLTEIAESLQMTEGTVSGHLAELIQSGVTLSIERLVAPARIETIQKAMKSGRTTDIRKLKALLDESYSYAELRLVVTATTVSRPK